MAGTRAAVRPFGWREADSLGHVFETLSDRLTQVFSSLRGRGKLSQADIDATAREIRIALLEADVALPVARDFIARVKERASSEEVSAALNPTQQVVKIVHDELVTILGGEERRLRFAKVPPTVIMLAGLQGSGKTTLAAKLALWLREQGNTPLLVAADLQRPNAVQQLQVLGERAAVPVFAPEPGNGVGDPVAVARRSVDEARHRLHNVVVIDTAGRLGIDQEMMGQAIAIRDATDPDEILFVVDAMIGQDAVTTAQAFLDGVGYDGVVLTKLDGDARGGAALSIAHLTGRPIMFASTGEKLEDFDVFHPDRMASRILDMGDILTLIEQAERAFDAEQAATMAGKLASGEGFTLEDFVEQLAMVRKLGPIGNLLGMLPGAAQNRELLSQVSDKDLDRAAAIVNSMTPAERRNPKILNGSRRARIAGGAGVTVGEVNNLVVRFLEGQKMMRQMMGGGGMPGMPAIPGMRRAAKAKARKGAAKKKPKGGRPGGAPGRNAASSQSPAGAARTGGAPDAGAFPGARGTGPGAGGPGPGRFGASGPGAGGPGVGGASAGRSGVGGLDTGRSGAGRPGAGRPGAGRSGAGGASMGGPRAHGAGVAGSAVGAPGVGGPRAHGTGFAGPDAGGPDAGGPDAGAPSLGGSGARGTGVGGPGAGGTSGAGGTGLPAGFGGLAGKGAPVGLPGLDLPADADGLPAALEALAKANPGPAGPPRDEAAPAERPASLPPGFGRGGRLFGRKGKKK
jgi:signal recognition particle subunit SRP54